MAKYLALFLLLATVGGIVFWKSRHPVDGSSADAALVTIKGYVGGEKMGFIQNPRVLQILQNKYHLVVTAEKKGSVQMVTTEPLEGISFLWPGSDAQVDLYRTSGKPFLGSEVIFNSPIVIYSWREIAEALQKQGIVNQKNSTYYIVDMARLTQSVIARTAWKDFDVTDLQGSVKVVCTHPLKSNSGSEFFCLMATVLSGNETLETADLPKVIPPLHQFFLRLGHTYDSSGTLFSQYLQQGMGAFPLAAGYESQIIEFAHANPSALQQVLADLRMLYPQPTLWSSHPLIAVDDSGKRLIAALQDPQIQEIAWKEHGFRAGNATLGVDTKAVSIPGIPTSINSVISMPAPETLQALLQGVTAP